MKRPRSRSRGFTLIEVLVVVAIIALLISILLPSLAKAREVATRAHCGANFMSIGKAWHMYANDHRDWFPASWAGGFWSFVFDFNKVYFDKRKQGGDVFMCPTWVPPPDTMGRPLGWNNLTRITGSDGHAVLTGYDFWTHMVWDPYSMKGGRTVIELTPIREHTRKFLDPSSEGSWAEALVDRGTIVPWLNKTTDIGGLVRDKSVPNEWVFTTRRISPSDQRMSWDQVQYSETDYGQEGFNPAITRHYRNGPTGANVLYGDGHVRWRKFKDMVEVDMGNGYKQFY